MGQEFDIDEVCPVRYMAKPLAPLVAAQQELKKIDRKDINKVVKIIKNSLLQHDDTVLLKERVVCWYQ